MKTSFLHQRLCLLIFSIEVLHFSNNEQFPLAHSTLTHSSPRFVSPIKNVTIPAGREARLACTVDDLGIYKVAWIYKGQGHAGRTVLTVSSQTITKNPRIAAFQEGNSWILVIREVRKRDEGTYLCQVNTRPPTSQLGFLIVVVPPVIDDATSSNDVTIDEGYDVILMCDAKGDPTPVIRWIREDGQNIGKESSTRGEEITKTGATLTLSKVRREDAGAYLCIATNGIPPAVSKRIILSVNFPPRIYEDPLRGPIYKAVLGTDLNLSCRYKARPKGKVTWLRESNEISSLPPFVTITTRHGQDSVTWNSRLSLRLMRSDDFGTFHCSVENRLGQDQMSFPVVEVTTTSTTTIPTTTIDTTTWRRTFGMGGQTRNHHEFPNQDDKFQHHVIAWLNPNETSSGVSKDRFVQDKNPSSKTSRGKNSPREMHDLPDSFFGSTSGAESSFSRSGFSHILSIIFLLRILTYFIIF